VKREIESLNLNDIDVEELERRIELGQMTPIIDGPVDWDCDVFHCGTFEPL
jgi:hypothetical protein